MLVIIVLVILTSSCFIVIYLKESRVEAQRGISDSVAVDDTMRIHGKMHNKQSQTPGSSRGFDKQFDVEFQRKGIVHFFFFL